MMQNNKEYLQMAAFFEEKIENAKAGKITPDDMLSCFSEIVIFVPSSTEVQEDGKGLEPLFFDKEENVFIAVYTHHSRMPQDILCHARYGLLVNAKDFIRNLPNGYGVVVNPGFEIGFELPSAGVEQLKNDYMSGTG